MYPSVAQLIGFMTLVIIMSGVAILLNRRIEKRRMAEQEARNSSWVQLDVRHDAGEEPSSEAEIAPTEQDDERSDENNGQGFQERVKQNGHRSESTRPS